jgi:hypothetical protein
LQQDRFLMIPISNTRFVPATNDSLVLDRKFDFLLVEETLLIVKLNTLERIFGYDDAILSQAQHTVQAIDAHNLLENMEPLLALALDLPSAKKLIKVRRSPVLQVPTANVINFIRNHPKLNGKIRFNADETLIALNTGVSKAFFLKLLNDDFLFSQLTELQYDTIAKDKIVVEEAN